MAGNKAIKQLREKKEKDAKDALLELEPKTPKKRGRQAGSPPIVREPATIIELNKDYRIKMDKIQYTLQVKGKPAEKPIDDEEELDSNFTNLGYYGLHNEGLRYLALAVLNDLTIKKSKKDLLITWEKHIENFNKSFKELKKMFAPLDITLDLQDSSVLKRKV